MGGGGAVWDAMAYDSGADILYVGTGNGWPWNAHLRSPKGGDNLFLASILAVKPDNGKMVWYFQETPGDTWDYTSVQPIILGITLSPGAGGAHNWHPMSFNPATGLVHIPGQEGSFTDTPDMNFRYVPGYWNTGTNVGRRPPDNPFVAPPKPEGGIPMPEGAENAPAAQGGFLVAWDPVAQKERWRVLYIPAAGGGAAGEGAPKQ